MIERLLDAVLGVLYRLVWRRRALPEQKKYLPKTLGEYNRQRRKYGIAEGQVLILDGDTCLVQEIEGSGEIDTRVEYRNLDESMTLTTGLVNIHRQIDRKI